VVVRRVQVEADGQEADEGGERPNGGDGGRHRPPRDPLGVLKRILDMHVSGKRESLRPSLKAVDGRRKKDRVATR